ncbi:isocitrate lyase/PEP mutase family protein [Hamadaea tsunoensis]|uniref:isocitrate lyase/PEP mutase family protein n=1 Tax=Hamadaea tsunoensis TaxID=53368 RepID=UPI0004897EE0|nr:isocitrate lyase/phosphoenolpyruvate mutase family protein [Hamadaea tsunoensis]
MTFRALHHADTPLVLVNAWDVASARVVEDAGAPAVATTSAGVAWSLGAPDGDRLTRDLAVEHVRRIVAAVRVPVTADIESGFGDTPEEVGETVRAIVAAGAVGINLEDSVRDGGPTALRDVPGQVDRIAAARAADPDVYINARVDPFLRGGGFDDAVRRAAAYLAAGADGIFVPGVADLTTIAALVKEIPAPLNILVGPGSPSVAELASVGVHRVSLGSAVAEAAYAVAARAAREAYTSGTYQAVSAALDYDALNSLFE